MNPLPHLPAGLPDWALPAAGVAAVALLALVAAVAGRRTRPALTNRDAVHAAREAADQATLRRWRASATGLTILAAGIATATALNGMWHVFGDALGLDWPARLILVGFLEIPLVTSAIRARVAILEGRTPGSDGAAVWVLALLSAGLSAADADTTLARALRFVVPLVAAWMWHQSLAADRHHHTRHGAEADEGGGIAWRWTPRRLAVRLGLADPTHRPGTDVDRARRLAQLTKARLRLAVLSTPTPRPLAWLTLRPLRRALAAWRLRRHALAAVEHLHLGTDPTITATITTTVAAVTGLAAATDPTTLTRVAANPWADLRQPIERPPTATDPTTPDPEPAHPSRDRVAERIPVIRPDRAPLDRQQSIPTRSPSTADHGSDPAPSAPRSAPRSVRPIGANGNPSAARAADVVRLREAIADGQLPAAPSVEAVRRHLQISPNYARAARASVLSSPTTTASPSPGQQATSNGDDTHDEHQNKAEQEGRNTESGIRQVTTRAVLIPYPTEKAQESIHEQGTDAVRLP